MFQEYSCAKYLNIGRHERHHHALENKSPQREEIQLIFYHRVAKRRTLTDHSSQNGRHHINFEGQQNLVPNRHEDTSTVYFLNAEEGFRENFYFKQVGYYINFYFNAMTTFVILHSLSTFILILNQSAVENDIGIK